MSSLFKNFGFPRILKENLSTEKLWHIAIVKKLLVKY
jgi:hypothetical protein